MTRREIREEIFKFLFEYELVKNDVDTRLEEIIQEEKIRKEEHKEFLKSYVTKIIENESFLVAKIKNQLDD